MAFLRSEISTSSMCFKVALACSDSSVAPQICTLCAAVQAVLKAGLEWTQQIEQVVHVARDVADALHGARVAAGVVAQALHGRDVLEEQLSVQGLQLALEVCDKSTVRGKAREAGPDAVRTTGNNTRMDIQPLPCSWHHMQHLVLGLQLLKWRVLSGHTCEPISAHLEQLLGLQGRQAILCLPGHKAR